MPTQKHLEEKVNEYFKESVENKETFQSTYQHITDTISHALQAEDYVNLLSIIQYIESPEGQLAYRFSGKTHRILRYLHIIRMEYKYQCPLFCEGCQDADSLYAKYVSCMFAIRRLTFRLSPESVEEAESFLRNTVLSPFAVYTIVTNDRIEATNNLYMQILDLYSDIWSDTEIQIFTAFTNSGGNEK